MTEQREWVDRYGGAYPDLDTMCKGQCDGFGFFPTQDRALWPEGAKADELGYVLVMCPDCKGSGRRDTKSYVKVTAEGVEGFYVYPYSDDPATFKAETDAILDRIKATGYQGNVTLEVVQMTETEYVAIPATFPEWPDAVQP